MTSLMIAVMLITYAVSTFFALYRLIEADIEFMPMSIFFSTLATAGVGLLGFFAAEIVRALT